MLTRRRFLKNCALVAAAALAAPLLTAARSPGSAGDLLPIPLYHRIGDAADPLTLSRSSLAADLRWLADRGYKTLTADRLKQYILAGRPLPARSVFITFDDGYADHYDVVFPLLMACEMSACFFVISDLCGQPGRLTAAQMREMADGGMDFGSHTVTHRPLATLDSPENLRELAQSKTVIENILGEEIGLVAYPHGSYSAVTIEAARAAGYWGGLTVRSGYAAITGNELTLSRIPLFRHNGGLAHHLA